MFVYSLQPWPQQEKMGWVYILGFSKTGKFMKIYLTDIPILRGTVRTCLEHYNQPAVCGGAPKGTAEEVLKSSNMLSALMI